jgi:hypothetical protein
MRKLDEPFCAVCSRVIADFLTPFDPTVCLTRDVIDSSRWWAVATILFGVIQDGGGVVWIGGKPVPIDPWGPLRLSLSSTLANPYQAPPAMRDALVGMALSELSSLVSSPELRAELEGVAGLIVDKAAGELPAGTIR